jgi:hypothetical protein
MRGSLYRAHTQILYSFMPKGQPVFIPVVELSGYSTGSLINEIGYGMLAEQIFLYKKGYEEFLREFGKVFGEWSNY